jgi:8-oxo-dGTP pyrophosphatase MutT (NUDIX family)
MKEYVLCYVESEGSILLIEKLKPDWQKGKINLPGGSIELGETPKNAAARELYEEANILSYHVEAVGVLEGQGWKVHVMRCTSQHPEWWEKRTAEPVFWLPIREAVQHPKLIPNLRTIIPMAHLGVHNWTIFDGPSLSQGQHIVEHPCVSPRTSRIAA